MKRCWIATVLSLACLFASVSSGGLIHHYTLDGHADDGVGGWDGTMQNTTVTADRNGQASGALHFNGTNAYVAMPNFENVLNYNKDWSLNIWANATVGAPEGMLFGGGDGGSHTKMLSFSAISNRVTNNADTAADYHIVDYDRYNNSPNGDGRWHMYTLTWDNAGVFSFYVDGTFFGVDSIGSLADYYPDAWIPLLGANNAGFYNTIRGYFNGALDDFRIYDHTLSQGEIDDLAAPIPAPSALLLGTLGAGICRWYRRRRRD